MSWRLFSVELACVSVRPAAQVAEPRPQKIRPRWMGKIELIRYHYKIGYHCGGPGLQLHQRHEKSAASLPGSLARSAGPGHLARIKKEA